MQNRFNASVIHWNYTNYKSSMSPSIVFTQRSHLSCSDGWRHTRWGPRRDQEQAARRLGCCSDSCWHRARCICHVGGNPSTRLQKSPTEAAGVCDVHLETLCRKVCIPLNVIPLLFSSLNFLPGTIYPCQQNSGTKCNDIAERPTGRSSRSGIWGRSYCK